MDRETTLRLILASEPGILERINAFWERSALKRLNWNRMENMLVMILRSSLTADQKVFAIDEALAAFTKRGHAIPWTAPTTSMLSSERVQEIRDRQEGELE